ncbi:unnamed protein product (macronuclear) [Paramecium tetraurelia]|uniref:Uncharacterized protein n=1 Tax=Paramecium tetraurelia TaxID=5888 RepID=A0BZ02_PARTE|nr:uncharacterized protein GSPATT00033622001 [Paramecium tetraurelia]CAK63769.1 unnamed protein product [Paramecium tetraurelia]|eukprot:XP_001431167.1 hypothetical protein (macronuclear) [Paramecium tetraurelia strain d4-2]
MVLLCINGCIQNTFAMVVSIGTSISYSRTYSMTGMLQFLNTIYKSKYNMKKDEILILVFHKRSSTSGGQED